VNRWKPVNGEYVRTTDPTTDITRRKLDKSYLVEFSVELLLYKEQPIVTPDNVIIPRIVLECRRLHAYARVWYMGSTLALIYGRGLD
jgi:hypothetical protein